MGVTLAHLITGASDDRLTAPISDPVSQPSHPTNPGGHTDHQERHTQERLARFNRDLSGYIRLHSTRPQALAFAMTDSPAGLLAWIAEKFAEWTVRAIAERTDNIVHWSPQPAGGHFAALEPPDLFVDDVRTFFRAFR
jgi:pimeloyl-ACP methyl ester carboxylesterase